MDIKAIDSALEAIDDTLRGMIDSDVQVLYDASRHIITSGGKRIRPRLALLTYLAAGGEDVMTAVPLASAIELVHTATLVHDDINDHSLTRRGKATVHSIWGRTFALLTGDYLFAKVYQMMAPYGNPYNILMSDACVRLVEGETLQALAAKEGKMDRETYKTIISMKTASLFEASAQMGAMLGGGDEPFVEALAEYGYNLGLAFQIVDDILDIVGDPEAMGKPVGTDVGQGRGVMAVHNGDNHLGADGDLATAVAEADPITDMMSQIRESGAVEIARMQAVEMASRSRSALMRIPPSAYRDELESLIDLVLEREQ